MATVLIVEDEEHLRATLAYNLRKAGYDVQLAASGPEALARFDAAQPDLVLLDVMLPRLDGFATCRRMRERGGTMGILMLTARDDVEDRVRGLDAGADDYLGKPFSLEELLARVRAFERRGPAGFGPRIAVGELVLDTAALVLWRDDTRIDLTRRECAVLEVLMREAGRIVARDRIVAHAWPEGSDHRSNVLEVLIGRIRDKIDRPFGTETIETVRGLGYRIDTA